MSSDPIRAISAAAKAESARRKQGDKALDITNEELDMVGAKLKDPEFRRLFAEYVKELENPETLAANEAYLKQMEQEGNAPEGMQLLDPTPGICIRVTNPEKVFINICVSDLIQKHTFEKKLNPKTNREERAVQIPHSAGLRRRTKDKKGKPCSVVDVVFNTQTFGQGIIQSSLQAAICEIALDAASRRLKLKLSSNYTVLSKNTVAGGKPPMMSVPIAVTNANSSNKTGPVFNDLKSDAKQKQKQNQKKTKQQKKKEVDPEVLIEEIDSGPAVKRKKANEPEYDLIHRGTLELTDFETRINSPLDDSAVKQAMAQRPRQLVVRVHLPLLQNARAVNLDISTQCVKVTAPGNLALDLALPYPVNEGNGSAKYNGKKRFLEIILQVLPPTQAEVDQILTELQVLKAANLKQRLQEEETKAAAVAAAVKHAELEESYKRSSLGLDGDTAISVRDEDDFVVVSTTTSPKHAVATPAEGKEAKKAVVAADEYVSSDSSEEDGEKRKRTVSFSLKGPFGMETIKPGDDRELRTYKHEITHRKHEQRLRRRQKMKGRKKHTVKRQYHKSNKGMCPVITYTETESHMTVVVHAKGVRNADLTVEVKQDSVEVAFADSNKKKFYVFLSLFAPIDLVKSNHQHTQKVVTLHLHKGVDSQGTWGVLERCELEESDFSANSSPALRPRVRPPLPLAPLSMDPGPAPKAVVVEVVDSDDEEKTKQASPAVAKIIDPSIAAFLNANSPAALAEAAASQETQATPAATPLTSLVPVVDDTAAAAAQKDLVLEVEDTDLFELD